MSIGAPHNDRWTLVRQLSVDCFIALLKFKRRDWETGVCLFSRKRLGEDRRRSCSRRRKLGAFQSTSPGSLTCCVRLPISNLLNHAVDFARDGLPISDLLL